MGTHGKDAEVSTSDPELQSGEVPGLGFSSSEEAALIDKFQNVGLHSNYGGNGPDGFSAAVLPLRPYAGDCLHYLKTGICKFGQHCRFNHPVKRTGPFVKDMDGRDSEKAGQHVECKYYLTAGGCKYGKLCRYSHSKEGSDNATPLLNFLGLPIRVGEKECPYYMRNGSCGYGAHCVFHHPEPSSFGELSDKSLRQSENTLGSLECEFALQQSSEASQPHQAPWTSRPFSESNLSCQDNSHHIIANSFPQEVLRHSELNQQQAQEFPYQRIRHAHLTPGANRADMLQPIISREVGEFPERPGQPECVYFMKTGNCKFKSECRFHHPKGQLECLMSEKGLPLRPGRSICRHYERFGVCKFGRACLFDHPGNHNLSKFQDWSPSKPATGTDGGPWSELL